MTRDIIPRAQFSDEDFAPYGEFVDRPDATGSRRMFSRWFGGSDLGPVFHTNAVPSSELPLMLTSLEQHPHAAQSFVPLDVSRYLVTVARSDASGAPLLDTLEVFILPGTRGVIYAKGVWHAAATVLDRIGNFVVLMWRGRPDDDVFVDIPQHRILAPDGSSLSPAEHREPA